MSCLIKTISVPSGGKVAEILEDMKRNGKNVSHTVCEILERHSTLYDDNIKLEEENRELLRDYHAIISAAKSALSRGGEEWELYFPSEDALALMKHAPGENFGNRARVHFRMVDRAQSDNDS